MSRQLLCLLLLSFAVRLPWVFILPAAEAPDEYTHLWVVEFLKNHWRLPSAAEVLAAGPIGVYGSLPQFGYLPQVAGALLFGSAHAALGARLASMCAGVSTVCAGYFIGRELFSTSRTFALALPLMLAFHPQLVFVNSYANNDATACAISTWIICLLVCMLRHGVTLRRSGMLAFALAWLSLCKYSGWTILPAALITVAVACYIHAASWTLAISSLAIIALALSGTTGIWLIGNYHKFSGDWLGTKTMYHTWAVAFHRQLVYHISPDQVIFSKRWWRFFLFSFWAMFGYTNRLIWRPLYYVFLGFHCVSAGGWMRALAILRPARSSMKEGSVWLMLLLCCLFNLAGMVYASMENLGGPQGRYMLISDAAVIAILLGGIQRIPRAGKQIAIALVAFTASVCAGSWLMLFRIYGMGARF